MRRCCAIVSIRYSTCDYIINNYLPKFEVFYVHLLKLCHFLFESSYYFWGEFNPTFFLKMIEFTSYIGGLLSVWLGFSLVGAYDVLEAAVLHIYRYLEDERKKTSLNLNPITMPTIDVYDPIKMNYDQQYRRRYRRDMWRRKAKVATIIQRMTQTPPR